MVFWVAPSAGMYNHYGKEGAGDWGLENSYKRSAVSSKPSGSHGTAQGPSPTPCLPLCALNRSRDDKWTDFSAGGHRGIT